MHWFTKYFVVFALPPYIHCKTCGKLHTVTNLSWIFRLKTVFYWLVIDTLLRIVTFLICTEYDACSSSGCLRGIQYRFAGSCSASASLLEMPDSNTGPLPQKSSENDWNFGEFFVSSARRHKQWLVVVYCLFVYINTMYGHPPLPIYQQHAC